MEGISGRSRDKRAQPANRIEVHIRPKLRPYRGGDGPKLAPIGIVLKNDSTAYITHKYVAAVSEIRAPSTVPADYHHVFYVVKWTDLPAASVAISARQIITYVSPRVLEDFEYELSLEVDRLAELQAQEKADSSTKQKGRAERTRDRNVLNGVAKAASTAASLPVPSLSTPQKPVRAGLIIADSDVATDTDEEATIRRQLNGDMDGLQPGDSEAKAGPSGRDDGSQDSLMHEAAPATASAPPRPALSQGPGGSSEDSPLAVKLPAQLPTQLPTESATQPAIKLPTQLRSKAAASSLAQPLSQMSSQLATKLPTRLPNNLPASSSAQPLSQKPSQLATELPMQLPTNLPASSSTQPLSQGSSQPTTQPATHSVSQVASQSTSTVGSLPANSGPTAPLNRSNKLHQTILSSASFTPAGRSSGTWAGPGQAVTPQPAITPQPARAPQPATVPHTRVVAHSVSTPKSAPAKKASVEAKPTTAQKKAKKVAAEAEPEYVVKGLEDERYVEVDGTLVRQFKVRWEGNWPPDQNPTWEPIDCLPRTMVRSWEKTRRGSQGETSTQPALAKKRKYESVAEAFEGQSEDDAHAKAPRLNLDGADDEEADERFHVGVEEEDDDEKDDRAEAGLLPNRKAGQVDFARARGLVFNGSTPRFNGNSQRQS